MDRGASSTFHPGQEGKSCCQELKKHHFPRVCSRFAETEDQSSELCSLHLLGFCPNTAQGCFSRLCAQFSRRGAPCRLLPEGTHIIPGSRKDQHCSSCVHGIVSPPSTALLWLSYYMALIFPGPGGLAMLGAPAGFPMPGKGQQCPAQAEAFPHG